MDTKHEAKIANDLLKRHSSYFSPSSGDSKNKSTISWNKNENVFLSFLCARLRFAEDCQLSV